MNKSSSPFNPWPYAIIAFFVIAFIGIVSFTIFATRQRMELVRPDYYEEEMTYQSQLDRLERTRAIRAQVTVDYDVQQQAIKIALPNAHAGTAAAGRIQFYRPSDARLDHNVRLAVDAHGRQDVDARNLKAGLWKVRLFWEVDGQEYYFDRAVVVGTGAS